MKAHAHRSGRRTQHAIRTQRDRASTGRLREGLLARRQGLHRQWASAAELCGHGGDGAVADLAGLASQDGGKPPRTNWPKPCRMPWRRSTGRLGSSRRAPTACAMIADGGSRWLDSELSHGRLAVSHAKPNKSEGAAADAGDALAKVSAAMPDLVVRDPRCPR